MKVVPVLGSCESLFGSSIANSVESLTDSGHVCASFHVFPAYDQYSKGKVRFITKIKLREIIMGPFQNIVRIAAILDRLPTKKERR